MTTVRKTHLVEISQWGVPFDLNGMTLATLNSISERIDEFRQAALSHGFNHLDKVEWEGGVIKIRRGIDCN